MSNIKHLSDILLEPRISEKSTMLAEKNKQFVFRVASGADKTQIKHAVESMFNVQVKSVRVCNVPARQKFFKQRPGRRAGWKKAYVSLKPGFDIDFMGAK